MYAQKKNEVLLTHKNVFYMSKLNVVQKVFWNGNWNTVLSKDHCQIVQYFLKFWGEPDRQRGEQGVGTYGNSELSKQLKPVCIYEFVKEGYLYFVFLKIRNSFWADSRFSWIKLLKENIHFSNWKRIFTEILHQGIFKALNVE